MNSFEGRMTDLRTKKTSTFYMLGYTPDMMGICTMKICTREQRYIPSSKTVYQVHACIDNAEFTGLYTYEYGRGYLTRVSELDACLLLDKWS